MGEDDDCEMRNGNYPLNSKCWKCFHIMAHERRLSFTVLFKLPYAIRNSSCIFFRGCHYRKKQHHMTAILQISYTVVSITDAIRNVTTTRHWRRFSHTNLSLSLSLFFCELRKRKSQQQLVITCDTQTLAQQINSFEKSRGIEGQGKNKQPHEIVLRSSSFFRLPFLLIFLFFLGYEQKTCGRCHADTKKTLKKLLLSDKFFSSFFCSTQTATSRGRERVVKGKKAKNFNCNFPQKCSMVWLWIHECAVFEQAVKTENWVLYSRGSVCVCLYEKPLEKLKSCVNI